MSDTNWGQAVTVIIIENNKVLLVRHTYGGDKNMFLSNNIDNYKNMKVEEK